MSIFDLPPGGSCQDDSWQIGYNDAMDDVNPWSFDPVYISGWCHGFCGAHQCSSDEAVTEYNSRIDNE